MFTVTFGQLRDPKFARGLQQLMRMRALPTVTATNIVKIYKHLATEEQTVKELYDRIIDEYVEKDPETGKMVFAKDETGKEMPGILKVLPGKAEELDAKIAEFHQQVIEVPRSRLNLEHVARDLTPEEIMALEPLWEPVPEEDVKGAHLKRV